MAVPSTKDDGDPFPDGAHVALTHWSNGGTNGNPDEQTGVWQYCDSVSGDVVKQFVHDFPFTDAPEGNSQAEARPTKPALAADSVRCCQPDDLDEAH